MAYFNGKEVLFQTTNNSSGGASLPSISVADNGKVLTAQNGKWVAKEIPEISGGTGGSSAQCVYIYVQAGELTEDEYSTLLSSPTNYIRFGGENGALYNCYLTESTSERNFYSSGIYLDSNRKKTVKIIEVWYDRLFSSSTYTFA